MEAEHTVLVVIFQHLPNEADLLRAGMVCSKWHQASKEDTLWQLLAQRLAAFGYLPSLWIPSSRFPTFFSLYRFVREIQSPIQRRVLCFEDLVDEYIRTVYLQDSYHNKTNYSLAIWRGVIKQLVCEGSNHQDHERLWEAFMSDEEQQKKLKKYHSDSFLASSSSSDEVEGERKDEVVDDRRTGGINEKLFDPLIFKSRDPKYVDQCQEIAMRLWNWLEPFKLLTPNRQNLWVATPRAAAIIEDLAACVGDLGYEPATEFLWQMGSSWSLYSVSCTSIASEILTKIRASLTNRYFDEYLPGLAPRVIDPANEEERNITLHQLDGQIRDYAISDSMIGLVLAFGYFGGKKARKMFLRIMRDEAKGNSSVRPGYCMLIYLTGTSTGEHTYQATLCLSIKFRDLKRKIINRINAEKEKGAVKPPPSDPKRKQPASIQSTRKPEDQRGTWVWCLTAIVNLLFYRLEASPLLSHSIKQETKSKAKKVEVETWEEIWHCLYGDAGQWQRLMREGSYLIPSEQEERDIFESDLEKLYHMRYAVYARVQGDVRRHVLRSFSLQ